MTYFLHTPTVKACACAEHASLLTKILVAVVGTYLSAASQVHAQYTKGHGGNVVYRVSTTGTDKTELLKVFHAVQELENPPNTVQLVVSQRISKREFLVHKVYDLYTVFWLVTKDQHNVADDEVLELNIAATGRTREYRTVLGATKTVREITDDVSTPKLTQEDFVAALKQGKKWTLKGFHKEKCPNCLGSGHIGFSVQKLDCPMCKGTGEIDLDCLVEW